MELTRYIDSIHQQLAATADAGGEEARVVAERLYGPLESAIRLALEDALAAAAEEITTELAPGSVELRLRGRDPEFAVTLPAVSVDEHSDGEEDTPPAAAIPGDSSDADDGGMTRINLRLPDHLKARIERAAGGQAVSVNSWLVRAASAALERGATRRPERLGTQGSQRYTGWAR
ncbi:MAG TPA: hypothetical protein VH498_07550 [Candidatus Dormibacteraeota bacterium]|nr:hypothetical protein [Candidatus Dormibacteraeota bacterium]